MAKNFSRWRRTCRCGPKRRLFRLRRRTRRWMRSAAARSRARRLSFPNDQISRRRKFRAHWTLRPVLPGIFAVESESLDKSNRGGFILMVPGPEKLLHLFVRGLREVLIPLPDAEKLGGHNH